MRRSLIRISRFTTALAVLGLLAACSSGPVKRVSQPAASIQQLTVGSDGTWSIDLRLQNFSSMPMRFDKATLALEVGGQAAGELQATPAISIGPESADVVTVSFAPNVGAKLVLADSLASRRSVAYSLKGSVDAVPDGAKSRNFEVDAQNTLTPTPGLDGVLR